MREIKFKVYDKHTKVLSDPFGVSELQDFNKIWQGRFSGQEEIAGCDMQYIEFTGLKDSKRNDIYEHDIVSFDGLKGKVKFSHQIPGWYIEYQRPPLRAIYTRQFNCTYGDGDNYIDGTIEKLGSALTNPELLK